MLFWGSPAAKSTAVLEYDCFDEGFYTPGIIVILLTIIDVRHVRINVFMLKVTMHTVQINEIKKIHRARKSCA